MTRHCPRSREEDDERGEFVISASKETIIDLRITVSTTVVSFTSSNVQEDRCIIEDDDEIVPLIVVVVMLIIVSRRMM